MTWSIPRKPASKRWSIPNDQQGMTLIEIIIVITLVVGLYAVALPQLNVKSGTESSIKLGQLASDIRSAYDRAVLTGRMHRLVFQLSTGDYWLEETDRDMVTLGDEAMDRDPTPEEDKAARELFEERFKTYEDMAGEEFPDPETGDPIKPTSPVVEAKSRLEPAPWGVVDDMEWGKRTIGPYLLLRDMQAEHHQRKQDLIELGPNGVAYVYFFPRGYAERAVLHPAIRKGEMEIDEQEAPYTVVINSFEGTAEVKSGYEDVDVHDPRR